MAASNESDSKIISEHIRVFCRQKPDLPEESITPDEDGPIYLTGEANVTLEPCVIWNIDEGSCRYNAIGNSKNEQTFKFDGVFGPDVTQQRVFETAALPIVDSVLQGYSGTIFAYGPTGAGKVNLWILTIFCCMLIYSSPLIQTFTMRGEGYGADMGVIPRVLQYMLRSPMMAYSEIHVSYLQIYCEVICDLLVPSNTQLTIRERSGGAVYVEGLSRSRISSLDDLNNVLYQGDNNRVVASTNMNAVSSRSHAALIVSILPTSGQETDGVANSSELLRERSLILVDLSGSERASASVGKYMRLEEAKSINLSLSSLGNCISALCENRAHIPYRDSKLTRLLQGSLGGGARTSIIVNIPSGHDQNGEIMSSLRFAARAVKVTVTAKVQRFVDYEALYKKAQKELDQKDNTLRTLEMNIGIKEDKIETLESTIESLRLEVKSANTKLKWQESNGKNGSGGSAEPLVNSSGAVGDSTSSAIEDIILQHLEDMEQLKKQMEKKVNAYKQAASQSSQELSSVVLELQNEKQKHLEMLKELRECRENLSGSERVTDGRLTELLSEISDKRAFIDELQEKSNLLQEQNSELKEAVQMLANRLEEAMEEMDQMVSKEEVEKMEFMFSDHITRLSSRVVQLENKRKNQDLETTKMLDDCGGALDFGSLSVSSSSKPIKKQTNNSKAATGGVRGIAHIQAGSKRKSGAADTNSNTAAGRSTGLVFSASSESVV